MARNAGFEVATGVGRRGVVAVLRNGKGPPVLVRADMAALPVKERIIRRVCAWRGSALNLGLLEWPGEGDGERGLVGKWDFSGKRAGSGLRDPSAILL